MSYDPVSKAGIAVVALKCTYCHDPVEKDAEQGTMANRRKVKILPCGHSFHKDCFGRYLGTELRLETVNGNKYGECLECHILARVDEGRSMTPSSCTDTDLVGSTGGMWGSQSVTVDASISGRFSRSASNIYAMHVTDSGRNSAWNALQQVPVLSYDNSSQRADLDSLFQRVRDASSSIIDCTERRYEGLPTQIPEVEEVVVEQEVSFEDGLESDNHSDLSTDSGSEMETVV